VPVVHDEPARYFQIEIVFGKIYLKGILQVPATIMFVENM